MTIKIIPTVLANTKEDFDARLQRLLPLVDELQVDIMDGAFVPSRSLPINEIPDMTRWPQKRFEAHLMVKTPGAHIQPMARRGFSRVIFHVEAMAPEHLPALLEQCRKYRVKPVLAINPETPIERLLPFVHELDGVLFLGVHPGFNGAPYVPETAARIAAFAKRNPNKQLLIQVDGGMTPETIGGVVAAGATRINSGSFVSNAPDPAAALRALQEKADAAERQRGALAQGVQPSQALTGRIIGYAPDSAPQARTGIPPRTSKTGKRRGSKKPKARNMTRTTSTRTSTTKTARRPAMGAKAKRTPKRAVKPIKLQVRKAGPKLRVRRISHVKSRSLPSKRSARKKKQ